MISIEGENRIEETLNNQKMPQKIKDDPKPSPYEKPNPLYANIFLGILIFMYLVGYFTYQCRIWPKEKEFQERMNSRQEDSHI